MGPLPRSTIPAAARARARAPARAAAAAPPHARPAQRGCCRRRRPSPPARRRRRRLRRCGSERRSRARRGPPPPRFISARPGDNVCSSRGLLGLQDAASETSSLRSWDPGLLNFVPACAGGNLECVGATVYLDILSHFELKALTLLAMSSQSHPVALQSFKMALLSSYM